MKWVKFAVRDAQGRLFTGHWLKNFSDTKPPRMWSRRHDAQYRIDRINEYAKYPWAQDKFQLPLEIVEVEVSVGEVRPAV